MVIGRLATFMYSECRVFAEAAQPAIRQLDPGMRARVLATLAGLIILGTGLMLLAWLGARATRRYMHSGSRGDAVSGDDWAQTPLLPSNRDSGSDE
jgi:hypothetical protein